MPDPKAIPTTVDVAPRERRTRESALLALLLCASASGCEARRPVQPDDVVRERITAAMGEAYQWRADEVDVRESDLSPAGTCRFYRATNRARMDAGAVHVAVTPDDALIAASNDATAAADVLHRCGAQAPAEWWAEVVSRFSGRAAGKVVLPDDKLSVNLVEATGEPYAAPRLARDASGTTLHYFVLQRAIVPASVEATLDAKGGLSLRVNVLKRDP
jgi:hypothetical protein